MMLKVNDRFLKIWLLSQIVALISKIVVSLIMIVASSISSAIAIQGLNIPPSVLTNKAFSITHIYLFVVENQLCSRCEALEKECNLLITERDFIKGKKEKLEEQINRMNNRVKELGEDHLREKQTLQKELQSMKDEHESLSRDFEKELQKMLCGVNEQQLQEMKNLQGQTDELKDQISKHKSEVHKITVQLMKEKSQVERNQEELVKVKKNLSREKKKIKEVKEELAAESRAKKEAMREVEKLSHEFRNQEAHRCEDIARLREATNVERSKCDALREEIERLRSMPGRKYFNNLFVLKIKKNFA